MTRGSIGFCTGLLAAWSALGVSMAGAQAAAEYAGAVSAMGSVGANTPAAKIPDKLPAPTAPHAATTAAPKSAVKHLPAPYGEPLEIKNRRELEQQAGQDAGKLVVRTDAGHGRVWINGKVVGDTPLLLMLAPDRYRIEVRGFGAGVAREDADLLPNETREVVLKIEQKYPSKVRLQ